MAKVAWNESAMQQHLFAWIDQTARTAKFAWMKTIFHPANGGHRHIATAERLKREGVRPGCPDVIVPMPILNDDGTIKYNGMAIELKVSSNKLTQPQAAFCQMLIKQSWFVIVVHDFFEVAAWHICKHYDVPYTLNDYCRNHADKWSSVVNEWSAYDYDKGTKGGFNG